MAPQQQPQRLQRLPRPTSMLFDLEMEEAAVHQHQLDAEGEQAMQTVSDLVSRAMAAASQAVSDVESACQSLLSQGTRVCAAGLGQLLSSNMGYAVSLRESLGGGAGGQCLRNLRHCCLVLQRPHTANNSTGSSGPARLDSIIVDPTFRDQFAIAHPSARYAAVLDALPAVFVGHAGTIPQLVELLCAEMSLAFQAAGIVLPPWRRTKSMLSKWQPRRSVELPATAGAKADAAAPQLQGSSRQQAERTAPAAAGHGSSSDNNDLLDSGSGFSTVSHVGSNNSNSGCAAGSNECQPQPTISCAAPLLADLGLGSNVVPVQRQRSFEPLQRVVGGFPVSLAAQQSPLVQ
eukprot:GHRQ01023974.1.p1 GENE.GHRQ01023974.1~~GHRQ01023974.1.p1  ORF type:complete len:347 (+),score=102.97 GHRQ01023974.1:233-1273(+)